MITIAWYLLKVIICSGILCGYYFLALRNKVFHRWNRFFLLASVVLALTVPLMKIHIFKDTGSGNDAVIQMLQTINYGDEIVIEYSRSKWFQINFENATALSYVLICGIFLTIFFIGLQKIFRLRKKYPETKIEGIRFITTDAKGTPFSFFDSIFWNNAIDLHSRPGQQIFNHEIAHVKEKHSYDKIFMNLVLIFFWINPFFWLMRKELNMIHEFIADKEALEDSDLNAFAEMILQSVYPGQNFSLTNSFFYSPLKRRIMMLTKNKNPKVSYLSRLLVLPLAAIVFLAFTLKVKNNKNDKMAYNGTTIIESYNYSPEVITTKIFSDTTPPTPPTPPKPPTPPILPTPPAFSENALYIIDGKITPVAEVKTKDPSTFQSIDVLKGEKAVDIYGVKGKDGVIAISTTKKNPQSLQITSSGKEPVYYVDGKEISKDEMKNISPNSIHSIDVFKGESATKKYGEKGKDGVVEIRKKSNNDTIPDKVFTKVENEAAFPGGPEAWIKFIIGKIQASIDSFTYADYGTCVVKFIVNTDGTVSDVKATTMEGTHLAKTSVNAIKNGPKWIPATQNGHTVAAYRLQPVTLTDPDKKK